jgi:phage nucleotide-binding protein
MSIQLKGTGSISAAGVKMLVYGQAGAGKTTLIKTLPHPVILSAEGGLLSLQDADLPYIEIRNVNDLEEAYKWVVSDAANGFESVALDSISEIAEVILSSEKKNNKDPRAAYGAMQDKMSEIIRAFRDITNKHVYFTAKCEKAQDETGKILYSPSMPGNKTGQALPYFFDLVMALRVEKGEDGISQRALLCDSDGSWLAKDRSSKLSTWEAPDLGAIISKIGGSK